MSKKPLKDNDSVRITRPVESFETVYGRKKVILPAGSTGAIICVFGDPNNPAAYLVEFHLEAIKDFAEAEVSAEFVESREK